MRGICYAILPLALLAGCLSSSDPEVKAWTVDPVPSGPAPTRPMEGAGMLFGASRLGSLVVDTPCDRTQFLVRKADGSVAHDHYNVFAAAPSAILRAPAQSGLAADGRLGHVVGQASAVSSDAQVEIRVKDLSLDCREAGRRMASAAVSVDVVKVGRGPRTVAYSGEGRAVADTQDGNYSQAFSQAFSKALEAAVSDALDARRK